jgi:hypothetical protein
MMLTIQTIFGLIGFLSAFIIFCMVLDMFINKTMKHFNRKQDVLEKEK